MKRKVAILLTLALIIIGVIATILLMRRTPRAGPWKLADGSEVSLAGVTYGKNHVMRYGDRVVDYLYPILPNALRKRFGCKVMSVSIANTNGVLVWFWWKGFTPPAGPATSIPRGVGTEYQIVAVDEHGMESESFHNLAARTLRRGNELLEACELTRFPRRSAEIKMRIYQENPHGDWLNIGEFKVPNRAGTNFPVWHASQLPVTVRTNNLEISLTNFDVGIPRSLGANPSTRAVFEIAENHKLAPGWTISGVNVSSASGESDGASPFRYSADGPFQCYFIGTLWLEEPAWKLKVAVMRTTNFPPEELWTAKKVPIPENSGVWTGEISTNFNGAEIGVIRSAGRVKCGEGTFFPGFTVRIPISLVEGHVEVVAVRDERGRKLNVQRSGVSFSTGGRGATIRELDEDYVLDDAVGVKAVDVTLVYTKIIFVELMARTAAAKEAGQK